MQFYKYCASMDYINSPLKLWVPVLMDLEMGRKFKVTRFKVIRFSRAKRIKHFFYKRFKLLSILINCWKANKSFTIQSFFPSRRGKHIIHILLVKLIYIRHMIKIIYSWKLKPLMTTKKVYTVKSDYAFMI